MFYFSLFAPATDPVELVRYIDRQLAGDDEGVTFSEIASKVFV
jgi:hypothetical protein